MKDVVHNLSQGVFLILCVIVFMVAVSNNLFARQYAQVERPKLGIGLSYELRDEKRENPFNNTKDTRNEFRERLAIETQGWVYHPALCQYTFSFEPEWRQIKQKHEPGKSGRSNVYFPGYFLDATFLERKPYTLHLFGNRRESSTSSAFASTSDTKTDIYGGDLNLKSRVLPTTISYSHLTGSQTGFYTSDEDRDDVTFTMRHLKKKSNTRLKSIYSDNTRTSQGITNHTKTSNSDIRNTYNFVGDRKVWLDSFLSHRWTESDNFNNSGLRLSENLFWNHRKNLRSDYAFVFDNNSTGDFENETKTLRARLQHGLYENLITTLSGGVSFLDSTAGKENRCSTELDFDYRRRIPWGVLNLTMGYDYEMTQRSYDERFIQVTEEHHILRTGDFTLLDNENIDSSTIRVTDTTGGIIYNEGIDYVLQEIDTFIRISRSTFGAIADGQNVLVSYVYLSNPDYNDDVFGQHYGISFFLWDTLNVSYRFRKAEQNILSGVPPNRIIDDTAHSVDILLYWRWTDTNLSYEDIDSTSGISTREWLIREKLTFRPARQIYMQFSGHYGKRRFIEDNKSEELYGVSSSIDWLPRRWCKFSLQILEDHVSGDLVKTTDINSYATLELFYRIWSARIRYEFLDQKDDINDDHRIRNFVKFEIIRTLW